MRKSNSIEVCQDTKLVSCSMADERERDEVESLLYRHLHETEAPTTHGVPMTVDDLEADWRHVMSGDAAAEVDNDQQRLEKQLQFKKRSIKTMKQRMVRSGNTASRQRMQTLIAETKKQMQDLESELMSFPKYNRRQNQVKSQK